MTVAKMWDGTQWVTIQGPPGPVGPQGPKGDPGTLLDVQMVPGGSNGYNAISSGQNFLCSSGVAMQLSYTPTRDVWWEVEALVGLLRKTDAAYHLGYASLTLSPADVDGTSQAHHGVTQHSAVNEYTFRNPRRMFKLASGIAYTCVCGFSSSGGTWSFYMSSGHTMIQGRAWER